MASRRKGRILAFQALYSWDAVSPGEPSVSPDLLDFSWLEKVPDKEMSDFSRLLVVGTIENSNAVDAMIRSHLKNWDFSRLNRVDLAVLRMSTYTLMFQDEVPPSIVIDEAIGISKEFGTDDSYRFINGVLDSIRKTLQSEKAGSGSPE
ncbi:transcription antitermination factor NusB [Treponema sp. TIM-1]|uniref:transcription antitermination factor NusB n=1 Tax=Treponema sp. TIM-1 TaxID=2898417 RepID=UPI003980DF47